MLGPVTHDVADGAPRARLPGEGRDIAVGGDTSRWNPPDRGDHPPAEDCHRPTATFMRNVKPPRLCSL